MPEGLLIRRANGEPLVWPYGELRRASENVKGAPLRFERGGALPEVLMVGEHSLLNAIKLVAPSTRFGSSPFTGGRWLAWIAAALATALIAFFVLYQYALPALGERMAMIIPVSWEEALGRATVEQMAPERERCQAPAVEAIAARLRRVTPNSPYRYTLLVLDTPHVNAFAAPGGYIVVFRGLIEKTRSPEELAGVLAHEIEHVEKRHGTRAVLRSVAFWALISLVTGDSSATLVQLFGMLGELRYLRDDEAEADRGAMRRMVAARIDARAMIGVYRMLAKESVEMPKMVQYFSTHPEMGNRIKDLERMAREAGYRAEPLLRGEPWPPAVQCN